MVSTMLLSACLAVGVAPTPAAGSTSAVSPPTTGSTTADQEVSQLSLSQRVRGAILHPPKNAAAVTRESVTTVCDLYGEVTSATDLSKSEQLRLRLAARRWLLKTERLLNSDLSLANTANGSKRAASSGSGNSKPPASNGNLASSGNKLPSSATAGGPGGGAVDDNALDLIELIQSTIAPQSWDVQGGPGTIRYYRPLHVLVIRQTGEVHGKVGKLAGKLRR